MTHNCNDSSYSLYLYRDDAQRAWGEPLINGELRREVEDFRVEEISSVQAEGEGDHQWLWVEKRDWNTDELARRLARFANVRPVSVGYAGLKDKRAVTRQWFSIDLSGKPEPDWAAFEQQVSGVRVLQSLRHRRKLKRGSLRGNAFSILVRHAPLEEPALLEQRIAGIREGGVPNYFGPQRFGRNGDNVITALTALKKKQVLRDQHKRGLYISAARSFIFNRLLQHRVMDESWNQCVEGDVMMLDGSQSIFNSEACDEAIIQRIKDFDIHPTGPMWGEGVSQAQGEALKQEQLVAQNLPDLSALLSGIRNLQQERRSLRLVVSSLQVESLDEGTRLQFELPAGCFATSVLREIFSFDRA